MVFPYKAGNCITISKTKPICETHVRNEICGNTNGELVQATKSTRRMPWHWEPMKDVISCDKLRGVANELRSEDF